MLKLAGACMILTGCFGMGLWYRRQFRGRVRALRVLCDALSLLGSEIRYGRRTLPECCEQAAHRLNEPLKAAFIRTADKMRENTGESFAGIFAECTGGPLGEMPLKEEDREEFLRFVSAGTFGDGQMQLTLIEQSREQLEARAASLERENGEKCRMALGLGAMSGLLIILVLC
ncbi:MAG: stage III sporulation protein AB [Butyrivibrio sp.]|nr:stage III sporulation protein AB [Acetatifactor muris]MCM1560631.1 stage III sporulation protein AB [Butyrivibrio sp.]